MSNRWGIRTIVQEHSVSSSVDEHAEEHPRFMEAFDGLQWLLARTPDVGSVAEIDGVEWWVYVQASDQIAKTPEIWVLYQVDEQQVIIEQINVIPFTAD